MNKILVINCGSTTLKCKLYGLNDLNEIAEMVIDRIGQKESIFKLNSVDQGVITKYITIPDHRVAVQMIVKQLVEIGLVNNLSEIKAVGHRVVAGGEYFKHAVIIDDDVITKIKELCELAPIHNPINLVGIEEITKLLPHVKSVAVFDTAFHQTMPPKNYIYSVPYEWYKKYNARKYGAHGISHSYLSYKTAQLLNKPEKELNMISCHLGAGSSICAIKQGKSYDTSMGFSPLTGTQMATRSGDVDISLVAHVMHKMGVTDIDKMINILNYESGFLGVSGISLDMRDVEEAANNGNERAQLSIELFENSVLKYIGQYLVALKKVDAITFSAGIGENSPETRKDIIDELNFWGIKIDEKQNKCRGICRKISSSDSSIDVFVVPTNEEFMIAKDIKEIL